MLLLALLPAAIARPVLARPLLERSNSYDLAVMQSESDLVASATSPGEQWAGPAALSGSAPASTIALGVYRPAFPDRLEVVDQYEQLAGAQVGLIHWFAIWGGWKSAFNRADLEAVEQRGSLPLISWEPWASRPRDPEWSLRRAILSGQHDSYIESWAHGLADYGKPVLLRFAHEMHAQSYPWALDVNGNTAEEYVAAWRHVHRIFERVGAHNVQWVWNPNTMAPWRSLEDTLERYRSLYPGDAYVDWVGLDIYNTGPNLDWGAPYWRSFDDVLRQPYTAITTLTDKPLLLPEVGSAEAGGSKAAWLAQALSDDLPVRFPRLKAVVWFDIAKEEQWQLHSSAQAVQSWAEALGRPSFAWPGRDGFLSAVLVSGLERAR